jgi:hypothetical protein
MMRDDTSNWHSCLVDCCVTIAEPEAAYCAAHRRRQTKSMKERAKTFREDQRRPCDDLSEFLENGFKGLGKYQRAPVKALGDSGDYTVMIPEIVCVGDTLLALIEALDSGMHRRGDMVSIFQERFENAVKSYRDSRLQESLYRVPRDSTVAETTTR